MGEDAEPQAQNIEEPGRPTHNEPSKKRPVCRFYNTKKGCRAGESCRFQHPAPGIPTENHPSEPTQQASEPPQAPEQQSTATPVRTSSPSKVVPRPTSKALMNDPRAFQINQIHRRFKPVVSEEADTTTLTFEMKPSDPDFPYDIEALECTLSVPKSYPAAGKPSLNVHNKDIPRGFQLNIERGFDTIAASSPSAYLLGLMNRLDQQLEGILGGQKAETFTIVSNRAPPSQPTPSQPRKATEIAQPASQAPARPTEEPSTHDLNAAKEKRQADVRQLEARFGRLPHYVKSTDGLTYTLPLDSAKRSTWPASVQQLRSFQLKLPERYPLEPLGIRLFNDSPEAKAVEQAFNNRSRADTKATITQHVNYLSSHVKEMATFVSSDKPDVRTPNVPPPTTKGPSDNASSEAANTKGSTQDFDDSHIKHIPRPPEWDKQAGFEGDSSSDSYDSDQESNDDDDEQPTEPQDSQPTSSTAPAERGILLSFPRLELHGIELLELTSLNLSVKCERCKEITDIEKLHSSPENSKMKEVSCKKCATTLAARFRADLIHASSVRAGYLDLDACTVADMLPSNFSPTCSQCSEQYPAPGIVAVRGDNSIAICRECHAKMSVKILEVKFLLVSASAVRASKTPGRKKPKENLGTVTGTELPNRGRCSHYKKSYRWFRFSCCAKVYPCDRCHDEQNDHPLEHANRMICGYCSREQNYRPEDCGTCHAALTGSKGRGFWEGGKGTRDPARMSRKDPRKFRNRNKTKAVKG